MKDRRVSGFRARTKASKTTKLRMRGFLFVCKAGQLRVDSVLQDLNVNANVKTDLYKFIACEFKIMLFMSNHQTVSTISSCV